MSPEVFIGLSNGVRQKKMEDIASVVCSVYGITVESLKSRLRKQPIPDARKTTFYLCRKYSKNATVERVGATFNRDHSTVTVACSEANKLYEVDRQFHEKMNECEKIVRGGMPINKHEGEGFKYCVGYFYDKPYELKKYLEKLKKWSLSDFIDEN